VGGYCSAPVLWAAQKKGIPTIIQEQNGYAGLTNKILGKKADKICVAYEGMGKFFPEERIVMTGNPIRKDIVPATAEMKEEGLRYYGLNPEKKHLLIVGGSLGSRTLNEAMKMWIVDGCPGGGDVEVLWQCGKYYKEDTDEFMKGFDNLNNIKHSDFIKRMDLAYAVADLVISRSGASSVSEICAAHKAAVLVPSPNVTEDHQTHNAMALVNRNAGVLVTDAEAPSKLMITACALLDNKKALANMQNNVADLAMTHAADLIAEEIYRAIR